MRTDERASPSLASSSSRSGVFPRAPSERPLRVLILLSVASLAVIDVLPFCFDYRGVWDSLVGYEGSYDTPVGLTAGILGVVVLLVALAGGRAQGYALRPCSLLLRPDLFVHELEGLLRACAEDVRREISAHRSGERAGGAGRQET